MMKSKFYTDLDIDQITQIIYLAESGFSIEAIARDLKISKKSVRNIINEALGGDYDNE